MDLKARIDKMMDQALLEVHFRQGEEKGKDEGYHAGTALALQWALYVLLQHRFRFVPDPLRHYIDYIEDEDRLKAAFRQAFEIKTIQELRI